MSGADFTPEDEKWLDGQNEPESEELLLRGGEDEATVKDMADTFLPDFYKVPTGSKYMKFEVGNNQFRILSSPILGYEYWKTIDGKRTPIRKRMDEKIDISDLSVNPKSGELEMPKHFWAMVIWNYGQDKVQLLEVTQKGVQKYIARQAKDADWGDPKGTNGYDFVVNREGSGLDTEYSVTVKPKKKLPADVIARIEGVKVDLQKLYSGDDPWKV